MNPADRPPTSVDWRDYVSDDCTGQSWLKDMQKLQETITKLRKYARHHTGCISGRSQYHDGECNCGWFELRDSLDAQ